MSGHCGQSIFNQIETESEPRGYDSTEMSMERAVYNQWTGGLDWNGMEWTGMEWTGLKWTKCSHIQLSLH